jgi:AhpD family alkylhydroperoxidase
MSEPVPRITLAGSDGGFLLGNELDEAITAFAAAAVRADAVDPMTTELVRLRCAQVHDCRLCGSLRSSDALELGLDERMTAQIARYETSDFDAAAIAALRLCDAIILAPASADPELAAELHRHFSDAQIAELCLDVMKWSHQKMLVALRLEAPPWQETTVLSFDENGDPVIGGPVDEHRTGR